MIDQTFRDSAGHLAVFLAASSFGNRRSYLLMVQWPTNREQIVFDTVIRRMLAASGQDSMV